MMLSMNGTGTERAMYKLIASPATMISDGRRSGRNARCGEDQGNCYCKSNEAHRLDFGIAR
jgi:hypothetical protein